MTNEQKTIKAWACVNKERKKTLLNIADEFEIHKTKTKRSEYRITIGYCQG